MLAKRDKKCGTLTRPSAVPMRAFAGIALLLATTGAHAESVFECSDAHGVVAFQAMPCASSVRQKMVDVRGQPLIDPDAPSVSGIMIGPVAFTRGESWPRGRRARASVHQRKAKPVMSYECRAGDGEVFYRHARCPHSIAGDGIARNGEDAPTRSRHGRGGRARNAWGSSPVSARKVPRSEACRRINAVASIDRDGNQHDEQVSVYDHDLGRDPCSGF